MRLKSIAILFAMSSLVACGGSKQDENLNEDTILVTMTDENGQKFALIPGQATPEEAQALVESGQVQFVAGDQFGMDDEVDMAPAQQSGEQALELNRNGKKRGKAKNRRNGKRRFRNRNHRRGWRPFHRRARWKNRRWRRRVRRNYWGWNSCGHNYLWWNNGCYQPYSHHYGSYYWHAHWGYASQRHHNSYIRFWF